MCCSTIAAMVVGQAKARKPPLHGLNRCGLHGPNILPRHVGIKALLGPGPMDFTQTTAQSSFHGLLQRCVGRLAHAIASCAVGHDGLGRSPESGIVGAFNVGEKNFDKHEESV